MPEISLPTKAQILEVLEELGVINTNVDSVNTNVNTVKADVSTILNSPKVVKSVQRGIKSLNFATDIMPNTIFISNVNVNKSIVLITVSEEITAGQTNYASGVYVSSFTSTSFSVTTTSLVGKVIFSWQVIEFY